MSDITIKKVAIEVTVQKQSDNRVDVVQTLPTQLEVSVTETTLEITAPSTNTIEVLEPAQNVVEVQNMQVIQCPAESTTAEAIQQTYIASETISALKIVSSASLSNVKLADALTTFSNAKCIGMALNAVTTGQQVITTNFGVVEDPFFNYPLNAPLFLTTDGSISLTEDPLATHSVTIGYGMGAGGIFIDIREPIVL